MSWPAVPGEVGTGGALAAEAAAAGGAKPRAVPHNQQTLEKSKTVWPHLGQVQLPTAGTAARAGSGTGNKSRMAHSKS
ncbi:MAG TPA: hypothetical protein VGX78_00435, partial [Pirellulales bacterium]|nr:hypothetical protein [Pirellulales bacterium]